MAMMMNVGVLIIDIYDFDLLDGLKSLISSDIVKVRSASHFLFPILIFDLKKGFSSSYEVQRVRKMLSGDTGKTNQYFYL